jgi:hypothetical protein
LRYTEVLIPQYLLTARHNKVFETVVFWETIVLLQYFKNTLLPHIAFLCYYHPIPNYLSQLFPEMSESRTHTETCLDDTSVCRLTLIFWETIVLLKYFKNTLLPHIAFLCYYHPIPNYLSQLFSEMSESRTHTETCLDDTSVCRLTLIKHVWVNLKWREYLRVLSNFNSWLHLWYQF